MILATVIDENVSGRPAPERQTTDVDALRDASLVATTQALLADAVAKGDSQTIQAVQQVLSGQ